MPAFQYKLPAQLKTKIKANSITNLTDARYFSAWEVEWLGFCLDPFTTDYVPPDRVKSMREWLDGPAVIGEFGLCSPDDIQSIAAEIHLDGVQVNSLLGREVVAGLQDMQIFVEVVVKSDTTPTRLQQTMSDFEADGVIFILNFEKNKITWRDLVAEKSRITTSWLATACRTLPILLALDCPTDDLSRMLEVTNALGLCVHGGAEEKVGFKSFNELDILFEHLQSVG